MSILSVLALKEVTVKQRQEITQQTQTTTLLFSQHAKSAILSKEGEDDETVYTLTLNQASPDISFLIDGSKKESGSIGQGDFFKTWIANDDAFRSDPPTAKVTMVNSAGAFIHFSVMLSHPVVDAKAGTVKYDLEPLPEQNVIEGKYTNVVLLISNIDTNSEKMFTVATEDGHSTVVTATHPIQTPAGLKMISEVKVGDPIFSHLGPTVIKTIAPAADRPAFIDLKALSTQSEQSDPMKETFFSNGVSVGDTVISPIKN